MIYGCSVPGGDMNKLEEFKLNNYLEIGWEKSEKPHLYDVLKHIQIGDFVYVRTIVPKQKKMIVHQIGVVYSNPILLERDNKMFLTSIDWTSRKLNLEFSNISTKGLWLMRKCAIYPEFARDIIQTLLLYRI